MTEPRWQTLAGRGRSSLERRGSTFTGYAAPARTVAEAESVIEAARADAEGATHVVTAYRIRIDDGSETGYVREAADGAGEPSGSAGKPTLHVLQQRSLLDVVVATVRHFGGTELGVGGLARAYARTASGAVDDAGVIDRVPHTTVEVTVDYDDSGVVRGLFEREDLEFDADYDARVRFAVRLPRSRLEPVLDRIRSATSGRAMIDRS